MTNLVLLMDKKNWAAISIVSLGIFYFSILWKSTASIDLVTTDLLFYGSICILLWRKQDSLIFKGDIFSSFIGLSLLVVLLTKSVTLFSFEATLIPLIPFLAAISIALITSGIRGIGQYKKELFFAWFLFFPTGVMGPAIDRVIQVTVLNAKFSTYFLYYIGFNVANQGNEVVLSLPESGQFKAIVGYPCAGVPMILLMLRLSLLLICLFPVTKKEKFLIPSVSVAIGFFLGVIRVCILTLLIPEPARFDYWHGSSGDQIFSTLAIIIFSGFAYWMLEVRNSSSQVESLEFPSEAESPEVSKQI